MNDNKYKYKCYYLDLYVVFNLIFVGVVCTIFMLPFVFYELAVGYSCTGIYWPLFLCIISKLLGESISFGLGKLLKNKLLPILF